MRKGLKIKVILVKKKIFIGIGAVLAIALLAGAAFMAVRLLNTNANGGGPGSLLAGLGGPGGGNSHVAQMLRLTPAPELPVTHPDLTGVVNSIQGNSVFVVQASNVSTTAGEIQTPNGPATEVVVSQKTLIYRDTTLDSVPTPQAGTTTSIGAQQGGRAGRTFIYLHRQHGAGVGPAARRPPDRRDNPGAGHRDYPLGRTWQLIQEGLIHNPHCGEIL